MFANSLSIRGSYSRLAPVKREKVSYLILTVFSGRNVCEGAQ